MSGGNVQEMLKEGTKYLTGLEEAILRNIGATQKLSSMTRTSRTALAAPWRSPSKQREKKKKGKKKEKKKKKSETWRVGARREGGRRAA